MAAGDTTDGRRIFALRVEDGKEWYSWPEAGDYWLDKNVGTWSARPPNSPPGVWGDLSNHTVTEHEDGTITVAPSILMEGGADFHWHGFLEHGVWREV